MPVDQEATAAGDPASARRRSETQGTSGREKTARHRWRGAATAGSPCPASRAEREGPGREARAGCCASACGCSAGRPWAAHQSPHDELRIESGQACNGGRPRGRRARHGSEAATGARRQPKAGPRQRTTCPGEQRPRGGVRRSGGVGRERGCPGAEGAVAPTTSAGGLHRDRAKAGPQSRERTRTRKQKSWWKVPRTGPRGAGQRAAGRVRGRTPVTATAPRPGHQGLKHSPSKA